MTAERCDVAVLGAGAMGSAAAWWLARRGRDVVLVDQFETGHTNGSSHGATRIFRLAYTETEFVKMARAALPLWHELEDDAGETLLDITGGLDHGPARTINEVVGALRAQRLTHELLSPGAAAERWPGMRFDQAVVFQPDAGRCRADATLRALQRGAKAHGAELRLGVGSVTVVRSGVDGSDVRLRFGDRELWPRKVVVTAGAWAPSVLAQALTPEELGTLPHFKVTLEQVQHFAPRNAAARWPSFLHHRENAPLVYGLESPGQGVKVDEHHAGRVVDHLTERRDYDPARGAAVSRYVERWLPGLEPALRDTTTCLYTTTPDERFVLQRFGPVIVGSPCSGHGFKFTPLIGRMLADLADSR